MGVNRCEDGVNLRKRNIGILSPLLDGFYYGNLHYALHRYAQQRNVRLITVRLAEELQHGLLLAQERVDGWILLRRSVSDRDLQKLRDTGKPVVLIGRESSICPTVRIAERQGTFEAVMHLIRHGHRRIAFIGDIEHRAMKQRYLGYLDALKQADIPQEPELTINPDEYHYEGGAEAADRVIAMNFPCTAAVASTDAIAFGFVGRLREKGCRVPEDMAVVGFDNVGPSAFHDPALTTVAQPYDAICEAAINRILLELEGGEAEAEEAAELPVELIIRQSCGCNRRDDGAKAIDTAEHADTGIKALNYLEQVIKNNVEFGKLLFQSTTEGMEGLGRLLPPGVRWGLLALWEELVPDQPDKCRLRITHYFHREKLDEMPGAMLCPASAFPPVDALSEPFMLDDKEMLALIPVRSENRDWGIMVMAGEYDITRTYGNSDAMTHFFNMIAFSMEREQLFEELRSREAKSRAMAERLELVSRATTDGIWEWDLVTNRMEYNNSFRMMLGWEEDQSATIQDFIRHIHPDDREQVLAALYDHWETKNMFQAEFRLLPADGDQLWVFISGSCIRSTGGPPVRIIGSVRDITLKKEYERKIKFLAFHDALTGLPNRLFFKESFAKALRHAAEHNHKLALLMVDLDNFKAINDTYGHRIGDQLLQFVAKQISGALRLEHVVARLGGDEFVILLPIIENEQEAVNASRAVLAALSKPFIVEEFNEEIAISGSIGISISPRDGADAKTLLDRTDSAMYVAKNSGKNRFVLFEQNLKSGSLGRVEFAQLLNSAISRGEFRVYYQPMIHLETGLLSGAEALLRWQRDESAKAILPEDFVPLAEEGGQIVPIGRFVLEEICRQLAGWRRQGFGIGRIHVNLSARQISEPGFAEYILNLLGEHRLSPSQLCFEVTETALTRNPEASRQVFERLGEAGIALSLDDFGTGPSSLAALRDYTVESVKIDRSFVAGLNRVRGAAIVQGMIEMAKALDVDIVAEGVETLEEWSLLTQMGCSHVQGFYVDEPLAADEFTEKYGRAWSRTGWSETGLSKWRFRPTK